MVGTYEGRYEVADVAGKQCIICEHGRIILGQGDQLVAVMRVRQKDRQSLARAQSLWPLGLVINDGSSGELWLQFEPKRFKAVTAIVQPRPAIRSATEGLPQ